MQMTGHKRRAIFDRYHIVAKRDLREAAEQLDRPFRPRTTTISTTVDAPVQQDSSVSH